MMSARMAAVISTGQGRMAVIPGHTLEHAFAGEVLAYSCQMEMEDGDCMDATMECVLINERLFSFA